MRVLKVKNEMEARRLSQRLLKKGYVIAVVEKEEEAKKDLVKKADVVIVVR
jgi:5,10-methylene-tetrahydrofolate dehydrogenase/methenyl tetrahydrofolate cyclohydrolase